MGSLLILQSAGAIPQQKLFDKVHEHLGFDEVQKPHERISEFIEKHKPHDSSSMEISNDNKSESMNTSTEVAVEKSSDEISDKKKEKINAKLQMFFSEYENGKKKEKDDEWVIEVRNYF